MQKRNDRKRKTLCQLGITGRTVQTSPLNPMRYSKATGQSFSVPQFSSAQPKTSDFQRRIPLFFFFKHVFLKILHLQNLSILQTPVRKTVSLCKETFPWQPAPHFKRNCVKTVAEEISNYSSAILHEENIQLGKSDNS